ncbi:MAG: GDP-L-fucose synthase, partial [Actinomycetota bacterium]
AGHVNIGTGIDLPIRELAEKIRDVVCPDAELRFDPSKPDGMPRKVLDTTKLTNLGWQPSIELDAGIKATYDWFLDHVDDVRGA